MLVPCFDNRIVLSQESLSKSSKILQKSARNVAMPISKRFSRDTADMRQSGFLPVSTCFLSSSSSFERAEKRKFKNDNGKKGGFNVNMSHSKVQTKRSLLLPEISTIATSRELVSFSRGLAFNTMPSCLKVQSTRKLAIHLKGKCMDHIILR
jgi:hypothetical protein